MRGKSLYRGRFGIGGVTGLVLGVAACALFGSLSASFADTPVPADSRLKTIAAKKVIRIAYRSDARPFAFVNDNKEPLGYTIDLCQQVVKSIQQQFNLPDLKVEWVPVTVDTRFSAVANGKADMECGSSTVTLSRMKEIDFSNLVFVESTGVLVADSSNIHSFAELAGKKIAVVSGTTNEKVVKEHLKLRDLEDVSSIFVTHEMNNLEYLTSEYAVVNEAGEVVFEKEGEKLCLINSKVLMMRDGKIIFSGTDETLRKAEDPYIHKFLRGH